MPENPELENPELENPELENPELENPELENPELENPKPIAIIPLQFVINNGVVQNPEGIKSLTENYNKKELVFEMIEYRGQKMMKIFERKNKKK